MLNKKVFILEIVIWINQISHKINSFKKENII